jgi:DNA-binding NtrC family response regulator
MPTVLIIDSDPLVRLMAARVLSNAGYVVIGARSVQDALWYLNSLRVDLLIRDVTEKQSFQDFSHIDPEMSVLGMIGGPDPPFQAGATLRKPFTASELLSAVRRCLAART